MVLIIDLDFLTFNGFMGINLRAVIYLVFQYLLLACQPAHYDWPEYHGDGHRNHYSRLDQINLKNVSKLKVAWEYRSGGADTVRNRSQIQCNPIIIDGILYGVSADIQAFAIDAYTGKEIWKTQLSENQGTLSRGVTYWADGEDKRIFFGAGRYLYAIHALKGEIITTFGDSGRINLRAGLERPGADQNVSANTPTTLYQNLLITGVRVNESETALLGDIRAFDARTGALVWTFKTIPDSLDTQAYQTWRPSEPRKRIGGANNWMGMAIDRDEGIVYAPTGSAAYDFWGGNRIGDNLYANCLLALDAATGRKLWHYQLVRHDIWDRDPPTTPNLVTIQREGKSIKAVVLVTKQGQTFVFDRITGEPIFPIDDVAFPQDAIEGELPAPTQPIPRLPEPFTRQSFTEKDFNPFIEDIDSLKTLLKNARTGSPYIPITHQMTVFFPGTDGGAQWGGAGIDPQGIMYVPAKEIPVYTSLVPLKNGTNHKNKSTGKQLYQLHCSSCHGPDRRGNHDGTYPSLHPSNLKMNPTEVAVILRNGKGRMPSFDHLNQSEQQAIVDFIYEKTGNEVETEPDRVGQIPFRHTGYNRWYHNGYPVSTPPWGTLTALDLNTGLKRWQVPLGEYEELTQKGIPITGTDNYGGPLVTAGGLVFIAATRDEKIRAFDKTTGEKVWEHPLPAAGYATPSTYQIKGRQFVVIACGGGKLNTKSGDKYVAFALEN